MEFYIAAHSINYLETGNRASERIRNDLELVYLALAEYLPGEDIVFKVTGAGETFSDRLNKLPKSGREKASKAVLINEERYTKKIEDIRIIVEKAARQE